ncbi:MAG: hypothetical protein ACE5LU_10625 [Anaerolineae bacterium]
MGQALRTAEVLLACQERLENTVDVLSRRTGALDPLQQGMDLVTPPFQEVIARDPDSQFLLGALPGRAEGTPLHTFDPSTSSGRRFVFQTPHPGAGLAVRTSPGLARCPTVAQTHRAARQ